MGTHPIFESDFDCLTDKKKCRTRRNSMDSFCIWHSLLMAVSRVCAICFFHSFVVKPISSPVPMPIYQKPNESQKILFLNVSSITPEWPWQLQVKENAKKRPPKKGYKNKEKLKRSDLKKNLQVLQRLQK